MARGDSRIGILIQAKADALAITSTAKELKSLDQAAGIAAGGMGALSTALGVAGFAALAAGAGQAVFSLAETAAEAGRTRTAFEGLAAGAGQSADEMLSAMQKASGGMISNADLIQSANRAMLLGVADSGRELAQLLEVARVRGAAMGLSVSQAFNDLVTGLGRMSPLILDNLGIVTGGEAVFDGYAASLGRTAESLTDAEKKQALFNKVVSETNELIASQGSQAQEDLAAPFERMDAAIQNAKEALGELFGPAVAVVAQQIADAARGTAEALQGVGKGLDVSQARGELEGLKRVLSGLQEARDRMLADRAAGSAFFDSDELVKLQGDIANVQRQIDATNGDLAQAIDANNGASAAASQHAEKLQDMAGAAALAAPAIANLGHQAAVGSDHLRDGAAAALEMRDAINQLASSAGARLAGVFSGASDLMGGGSAAFTQFERMNGALQTQINLWEEAGKGPQEIQFLTDRWIRTQSDSFSQQRSEIREAESEAKKYARTLESDMTKAASEAEKAFDGLKSKVSGVLSGALSDTAGVNPDDILAKAGIREDSIAENARRLADIAVNGFKDQDWLGEFKEAVPDIFKALEESGDPKVAAAKLLKEFQDGLRPELIDKESAKERVKQMLLGEASMEQLATEIAQELSQELGKPLGEIESKAKAALGVGDGAGLGGAGTAVPVTPTIDAGALGESFASGAAQAVRDSGVGDAMTAALEAQLKSEENLKRAANAGAEQGKAWGQGFLDMVGENVPARLIEIITNLVTPGVQAQLAQQASLTGAR